jgi:hypothetical protein
VRPGWVSEGDAAEGDPGELLLLTGVCCWEESLAI